MASICETFEHLQIELIAFVLLDPDAALKFNGSNFCAIPMLSYYPIPG